MGETSGEQQVRVTRITSGGGVDEGFVGDLVAVATEGLGGGYLDRDDLVRHMRPHAFKASDRARSVFVASAGQTVVGFAVTGNVGDRLVDALGQAGVAFDRARTALLHPGVVRPGWRGRGIGSRLVAVRLDHLRGRGFESVVACAQQPAGTGGPGPLLVAAGFVEKARIQDAWNLWDDTSGFTCPRCGSKCQCTAVVYMRDLVAT